MIFGFLPFFAFIAATILIFVRGRSLTLRDAILIAVALSTGWLVAGTEILSLFHAITFWPVAVWWSVPIVACVAWMVLSGKRLMQRNWKPRLPQLSRWGWIGTIVQAVLLLGVLAAMVYILRCAFLEGWYSTPNNYDSLSYHLPRQIYWLQQHSVEHFPTTNYRQLAMPPLTEYAGLHLMVLTGGDRLHPLVQWTALMVTMLAVSLIARRFSGNGTAQIISAAWVVTIPLAFHQASNTKNDIVVAMFMCMAMYWVLTLIKPAAKIGWSHALLIALSFGGLLMTKGTGLFFGAPIAVVMVVLLLGYHLRRAIPAMLLVAVVALAMNMGHFVRNYRVWGSIAPKDDSIHGGAAVANQNFSRNALISNIIRNIGPHFTTPDEGVNDKLTQLMYDLHDKLGMDINDPTTTWIGNGEFHPYRFLQEDENRAVAPLHMIALLLLPLGLLSAPRRQPWLAIFAITLIFIGGFLLFSILLKWQYWHVRLVIGLFAVMAPVFGWAWTGRWTKFLWPLPVAGLLLGMDPDAIHRAMGKPAPLPLVLNDSRRPLWGRESVLNNDRDQSRRGEYPDLVELLDELHPATVGLNTQSMGIDYPMLRYVLDHAKNPPRFVGFNCGITVPGNPEIDPDIVLTNRLAGTVRHDATGTTYVTRERAGGYALLVKEK